MTDEVAYQAQLYFGGGVGGVTGEEVIELNLAHPDRACHTSLESKFLLMVLKLASLFLLWLRGRNHVLLCCCHQSAARLTTGHVLYTGGVTSITALWQKRGDIFCLPKKKDVCLLAQVTPLAI